MTSEYILSGNNLNTMTEEVKNVLGQFNKEQSETVYELLKLVQKLTGTIAQ